MTGSVTFDAAHFCDAVTKASRIAPRKGAAFDKAAGLLFELDGVDCTVSATNLDVTYRQVLPIQEYLSDVQMAWRISSSMIATVAASLNMDTGQGVTFIDRGDRQLRLKQESFMAAFPMFRAEDFPRIPMFDTDDMSDGTDFSVKAAQVAWAAAAGESGPVGGVHIDGKYLYATDRYTLAIIPCAVALDDGPITVPLGDIASILRSATDVRLRATPQRLEMMLDKETQATSTIIAEAYPKVMNVLRDDTVYQAVFKREELVNAVTQMMLVIAGAKSPCLYMTFTEDGERLVLDFDTDHGRVQNTVACESNIGEYKQVLTMNPQIILNGVSNAQAAKVELAFGKVGSPNNRSSAIVTDGRGYEGHLMPMVPLKEELT